MGYTHYWRHGRMDAQAWEDLKDDARRIAEASGLHLVYAIGGENGDTFVVNGIEDDAHEDFILNPWGTEFTFCKTARKPYDAVVGAVLIAAKDRLGDGFRVTSDGRWGADTWPAAAALYEAALGREPFCPLSPSTAFA